MINSEANDEIKNALKQDLEEHKRDACVVRGFVFWAFQKSYQQQGKSFWDTDQLEIYQHF